MNIIKGLLDYFMALEREFHREFAVLLLEGGKESVHQLRVNLKKQVAFFHLLEALDPSFSTDRALEAYGKVYRKAGKVRNLQVERAVVDKTVPASPANRNFRDWLAEREAERRDRLHNFSQSFSLVPARRLGQLIRTHIGFLQGELIQLRLKDYLCGLLQSAAVLLRPENLVGEQLHNLRKTVKELFFNLKFINNISKHYKLPRKEIKELDRLQQRLGNWHDLHATLLRIERKQKTSCPAEVTGRLETRYSVETDIIIAAAADINNLIARLESHVWQLLDEEPLRRSRRKKKPVEKARKSRSSFPPSNIADWVK